jgi:PAS domain S-box-containing protein
MSIGRKFTLAVISALLAVTIATFWVFSFFERREEMKKIELFATMTGQVIEESLATSMLNRNTELLNARLTNIKRSADLVANIWLLNSDDRVKSGTDSSSFGQKWNKNFPHMTGEKRRPLGFLLEDKKFYRWVQPVGNRPECAACHGRKAASNGTIVIDFSMREISDHLRVGIYSSAGIVLISLFLTGAAVLALWKILVSSRLDAVVDKVRLFKEGAYRSGPAREGKDEFERLEQDFDRMASVIQGREEEKQDLVQRLSVTNADLQTEIGRRKEWEIRLREQKLFSDNLLQNSAVATFVLDVDHRVVMWNKACELLTGLPAAAMVGTDGQWRPFYRERRPTLADVVLDGGTADLASLYEKHSRSALSEKGLHAEGWYAALNGRDRYIIFDAAPIYNSNKELTAVIETLQDVTEQKKAEAALAGSEAKLRTIIETEPECVKLVGAGGDILEINRAGLAMLEADRADQVVGKSMISFVAREHQAAGRDHMERAARGAPETLEMEIVGLKGRRLWVDSRSAPLRNAQGGLVAILSVTRDITKRKLMEEQLEQTNETLHALIQASPLAVVSFDASGMVGVWNQAAERIFGWSEAEVTGRFNPLVNYEQKNEFFNLLSRVLKGESLMAVEVLRRRKNGSAVHVSVSSAPLRSVKNEVTGIISVIEDITERKHTEDIIRRNYDTQTAINWILHISLENLPLEKVLKQALDLILSIPWLSIESRGAIFLVNDERDALLMTAERGLSDSLKKECRIVPFGKCLCGRAAAKADLQFSDSIGHAHEIHYDGMNQHGHYCVPIKQGRAVLGVLNIYLKEKHIRDDREIDFLKAIASALAGVIRRSRAEAALQESEKRYRTLAEAAHDVIFIVDREGRVEYLNSYGAELFGMRVEEFRGKKLEEFFRPVVSPQERVSLSTVLETGRSLYTEHAFSFLDRESWLGTSLVPLKDENDSVRSVLGVARDITERKHSEQEREKLISELREALNMISRSHKEWQDTFDSITDMIAIIDREFKIVKANRAFSGHYGLHPKDMIGRHCHEFVHESKVPIPGCPHRKTIVERRAFSEEVPDKKHNKIFQTTTFPYFSPDGDIVGSIHVSRDITDEKEREMRLIVSERLAALGQMASGIAHEINNPLASIAGCSEGLLSRIKKGQCDYKLFETYLNIIQEEIFRCKSITTAMLSFVRKTTYEKKSVNINEMLDRTLEIIGFQGRLKSVSIQKAYQAELLSVQANEGELRQVFLAVITNALDAMADKGTLTLQSEITGNKAFVQIGDSGPGIPKENLPRIFEPFYTTKSEKGGTGLGLSIARKIIQNHNGTIEAISEPGKGSNFVIALPLS